MYFCRGRKRRDGSEGRSFEAYSRCELENIAGGKSTEGDPLMIPDDGYRGIRLAIAARLLRDRQ
jgi:hypothetical protein